MLVFLSIHCLPLQGRMKFMRLAEAGEDVILTLYCQLKRFTFRRP